MKKWIAFILSLTLMLSLIGCGSQSATNAAPQINAPVQELIIEDAPAKAEEQADSQEPQEVEISVKEEAPEVQEEQTPQEIPETLPSTEILPEEEAVPDENGSYDSRDEVAAYIHAYGHLPSNYITKNEAKALGWSGGSVEKYAKGKCIGGDRYGNYEGLLPSAKGRKFTECDIDTLGKSSRGAKRIIFSNDGLIYYTDDHYESFTLLYGEE